MLSDPSFSASIRLDWSCLTITGTTESVRERGNYQITGCLKILLCNFICQMYEWRPIAPGDLPSWKFLLAFLASAGALVIRATFIGFTIDPSGQEETMIYETSPQVRDPLKDR